ncbi:hypothetical protein PF005_g13577 [Phytophthora fragariae]|uniref:Uncharacterized protein n=1 Tax=Phytophthora fragariae TaxID=53985 RepID=A0A6A4DEE1_9STRA|nr:hypothetical protein PF003_g29676 [Phytophthora fragariae]KAE8935230.1 hypothetical protein PF009_g14810 [Phytophthora fragariae]KAE9023644.1 hypothetical protein PF011_g3887 [Phytophthora fragariae]KAE9104915.1 hypothetical protein PF010_g13207 [Phytophthora fragariae]KAE9105306.1 hypothetical protein PF007_g13745 [Phytophthora fragariae]
MVAAAFGACVVAVVATALGGFTCALPPTWRGRGSDATGGGLEAPTQTSVLFTLLSRHFDALWKVFFAFGKVLTTG